MDGTWDATGLLLDRFEEVEATLAAPSLRQRLALRPTRPDSSPPSREGARAAAPSPGSPGRVRQLAGPPEHEPHVTLGAELRDLHRDQPSRRDLRQRHRRGSTATPSPISTARLIPSRLGSATRMLSGACRRSYSRSTRSRAGDGSLCAITVSAPDLLACDTRLRPRQRMAGMRQHHQLVVSQRHRLQRAFRRMKRQHAEVEGAIQQRGGDVPRGHAPHLDQRPGDGRSPKLAIAGSSECTAASLAPMTTRPRRTCCSSRTASSASEARVSRRAA